MAMTIDNRLHLQPTDEITWDDDGAETLTLEWKGPYAACKATAVTAKRGDEIPTVADGNAYTPDSEFYAGYYVASARVRRGNGDTAVLSIACRKADTTTSQESGGSTEPIRDIFSLKSVRNDVSILAYCGQSASNPNRVAVEKWMRESDSALANALKYRESDGTVVEISEDPILKATVPLIEKIRKGVERVIRFYPQLTRRRLYYAPPADPFTNLGYVDTPPTPGSTRTLAPSGISTVIGTYEWLKVQDDCDEQQDGKWMRVESWIGILKTDAEDGQHPWDPDLYGPDRWPMPAQPQ